MRFDRTSCYILILLAFVLNVQPILGLQCFQCNKDTDRVDPDPNQADTANLDKKRGIICKVPTHDGEPNVECPKLKKVKQELVEAPTEMPQLQGQWGCMIMKVENVLSNRIQISKGCEHTSYMFTKNKDNMPQGLFHNGTGCVKHTAKDTNSKFEITMCFCTEDNCNKDTIGTVGKEDIEQDRLYKLGAGQTISTGKWLLLSCLYLILQMMTFMQNN